MTVRRDNPAPEQIIQMPWPQSDTAYCVRSPVAMPEEECSGLEQLFHENCRHEWDRNWSRILPYDEFARLMREQKFELLSTLDELDLVVEADDPDHLIFDPDDLDLMVDDDIDGTMDAVFAELCGMGDPEYGGESFDELPDTGLGRTFTRSYA